MWWRNSLQRQPQCWMRHHLRWMRHHLPQFWKSDHLLQLSIGWKKGKSSCSIKYATTCCNVDFSPMTEYGIDFMKSLSRRRSVLLGSGTLIECMWRTFICFSWRSSPACSYGLVRSLLLLWRLNLPLPNTSTISLSVNVRITSCGTILIIHWQTWLGWRPPHLPTSCFSLIGHTVTVWH